MRCVSMNSLVMQRLELWHEPVLVKPLYKVFFLPTSYDHVFGVTTRVWQDSLRFFGGEFFFFFFFIYDESDSWSG